MIFLPALNAREIAREGGIPALLHVMETHLHHHLIQGYCAACLRNLAIDGLNFSLHPAAV